MKKRKTTAITGGRLVPIVLTSMMALAAMTIAIVGATSAPTPNLTSIMLQKSSASNPLPHDRGITWDVKMNFSETGGQTDYIYFGEAPDANDGSPADSYDVAKPPAPMAPYIRAYTKDHLATPYSSLWMDYRHYSALKKSWNLTVHWEPEDGESSTTLTISWSTNKLNASEYDKIVLLENLTGSVLVSNMFTTNHYTFTASYGDTRFRINCSVDTKKPQIINYSPATGETGDAYTFSVDAFDNLAPSSSLLVKVNWVQGSLSGNDTMTYISANNFQKTITLDNYAVTPLYYHIYAKDTAKVPNANYTPVYTATISDDEYPAPQTDDTTTLLTTGGPLYFKLTVTDNIGVSSVTASYQWKQGGSWSSWILDEPMTKGGGNQWSTASINAPSDATEIHYYFQVSDGTNTVYVYNAEGLAVTTVEATAQLSPLYNIVTDTIYPTPSADGTTSPTTGDPITFKLSVTDNIDVVSVTGNYRWREAGAWGGWTLDAAMTEGGGNQWSTSGSINAPSDATDVQYYFQVYDGANTGYVYNGLLVTATEATAQGAALSKTVADNDNPSITADNSPATGTTGDPYIFDISATDNIHVLSVTTTWNHGSLSGTNMPLADDGDGTYSLTITTDNSLSPLTYTITVTDTSSNTFTGSLQTRTILDNDKPVITGVGALPAKQLFTGWVNITATVTDNIAVSTAKVNVSGPAGFTTVNASMILKGAQYYYNQSYATVGTYTYFIWAKDTSSNGIRSSSYQFEIFAELQVTTLLTGWNFVSVPFNLTIPKTNLFVIYGGTRYTWGQAVSNHIIVNDIFNWSRTPQGYTTPTVLIVGEGDWFYSYKDDVQLWATNLTPMVTDTFITHLKNLWNVVGVPFGSSISKSSLIVTYLGTDYTWDQAVANGYVVNVIFGWTRTVPQGYFMADTLDPGYCYWIYAYNECTLKRTP